jgi:predicted nucleic acid-binding protein
VVLVDSSVWIALLRGAQGGAAQALRELVEKDEAAIAPVIYQEILQGAKSVEAWRKLKAYFGSVPILLPGHAVRTYEKAAELYVRCRERGFTPRSPHDCLVARVAVEHGVRLLHEDRDFELIAVVERRLKLFRPAWH